MYVNSVNNIATMQKCYLDFFMLRFTFTTDPLHIIFCDARGTTTSAQHTIFQNSQDLTDHHYHPTYNSSNQFFNSFILFIHLPPSQVHFHTTAQTIALHLMFSWLVTLCRCCYLLCNTFFLCTSLLRSQS